MIAAGASGVCGGVGAGSGGAGDTSDDDRTAGSNLPVHSTGLRRLPSLPSLPSLPRSLGAAALAPESAAMGLDGLGRATSPFRFVDGERRFFFLRRGLPWLAPPPPSSEPIPPSEPARGTERGTPHMTYGVRNPTAVSLMACGREAGRGNYTQLWGGGTCGSMPLFPHLEGTVPSESPKASSAPAKSSSCSAACTAPVGGRSGVCVDDASAAA